MAKTFYWHGIKLLGSLMSWKPYGLPQSPIEKSGTDRVRGRLNPRSRNFLYEITTKTSVPPQSSLTVAAPSASLSAGPQVSMNLKFLQWQALMIDHSTALGPLSWCEDEDEHLVVATVVPPVGYPGTVSLTYTGAGFTPAINMYVLLRNLETGDGWLGRISSVGASSMDVQDCPSAALLPEADWEIVLIRFAFPDTAFMAVDGYDTATQSEDKWIPELTTKFKSQAHAVYPPSYVMDLG